MSDAALLKKMVEQNHQYVDYEPRAYRVRYSAHKKPPARPLYTEDSEQFKKVLLVCRHQLEEKLAYLLFVEGFTAEHSADIVGYSARQVYRIKKRLLTEARV